MIYLTHPGKASGCSTNTIVINSFISHPLIAALPPMCLRRRQAQNTSNKIDYVKQVKDRLLNEMKKKDFLSTMATFKLSL